MNTVADWLIKEFGIACARNIAKANIQIGDGAPGYWADILRAIEDTRPENNSKKDSESA
jgi:hypothetical protein